MKILVDMNLSPGWCVALAAEGFDAVHWSSVGDPRAPDSEIMAWSLANEHVVFTHDLDFGTLLALTHAKGPSTIQVRTQDVLPDRLAATVVAALRQFDSVLQSGALITIDEARVRARILPLV